MNAGNWTMSEAIRGFVAAIDWTEPWIVAVVSAHVICLSFIVAFRKVRILLLFWTGFDACPLQNINAQAVLFGLMCTVIMFAESLNRFGQTATL